MMGVYELVDEEALGREGSNMVSTPLENESEREEDNERCYGGEEVVLCTGEDGKGRGQEEVDEVEEPVDGAMFVNLEEVFQMLQRYAKSKGFSFVKFSNNKSKDGSIKNQLFACHRAGSRKLVVERKREKRKSLPRIGCRVRVGASRQVDGRWILMTVRLDHNHDVSPSKTTLTKQHWSSPSTVARRLDYVAATTELGGLEKVPCLRRDYRYRLDNIMSTRLNASEASALHKLFLKMQSISHDFFYEIDADDDGRIRNVFWVDARSQMAYKEFGDVIQFDTRYLLGEYKIPFAPFVGVNHHGQLVLMGCALLYKKDVTTFEWLFRTWMRAMGGVAPGAIVTDQCQNIENAVERVFPEARHRWCLWHILMKFPDKVGGHNRYDELLGVFKDVVYESMAIDEFEGKWRDMVMNFSLEGKGNRWEWFESIYQGREKWVPVFLKDHFWAGLSSTERSAESVDAYFDAYVHSMTTLRAFVERFEIAIANQIEKELTADAECMYGTLPCKTKFYMEGQFQKVYTHDMFKKVQDEMLEMLYCEIDLVSEQGTKSEYKVTETEGVGSARARNREFLVLFDASVTEVTCLCKMFTWKGLLCRHAMKVLTRRRVTVLPEKYILRRWRKDVSRVYSNIKSVGSGGRWSTEVDRQRRMEKEFYAVVDQAMESKEKCAYVEGILKTVSKCLYEGSWVGQEGAIMYSARNQVQGGRQRGRC